MNKISSCIFLIIFSCQFAWPMLVNLPAQQIIQVPYDQLMHLSVHHINRPHLHMLRLRDLQTNPSKPSEIVVGQAPSTLSVLRTTGLSFYSNVLSHLNKDAMAQLNKAAPYLALCAFVVQYAQIFNSRQPVPLSAQAIANLTPGEQRLHTLLQQNEQLKQRLKSIGWQAVFSLAFLHPKFNNSYESLETANDVRNVLNLLNPALRYSALEHLTNRYICKVKSLAVAQMSKLLVTAYRNISPNTADPSAAKTTLDLVAMASIYAVISPQIVSYCSQSNGVVATFAREKTLHAYYYLPEMVKQKIRIIKN